MTEEKAPPLEMFSSGTETEIFSDSDSYISVTGEEFDTSSQGTETEIVSDDASYLSVTHEVSDTSSFASVAGDTDVNPNDVEDISSENSFRPSSEIKKKKIIYHNQFEDLESISTELSSREHVRDDEDSNLQSAMHDKKRNENQHLVAENAHLRNVVASLSKKLESNEKKQHILEEKLRKNAKMEKQHQTRIHQLSEEVVSLRSKVNQKKQHIRQDTSLNTIPYTDVESKDMRPTEMKSLQENKYHSGEKNNKNLQNTERTIETREDNDKSSKGKETVTVRERLLYLLKLLSPMKEETDNKEGKYGLEMPEKKIVLRNKIFETIERKEDNDESSKEKVIMLLLEKKESTLREETDNKDGKEGLEMPEKELELGDIILSQLNEETDNKEGKGGFEMPEKELELGDFMKYLSRTKSVWSGEETDNKEEEESLEIPDKKIGLGELRSYK